MTDTDRELLELAAKAAGIEVTGIDRAAWLNRTSYGWNPLADDGDALRLAVKLGLALQLPHANAAYVGVGDPIKQISEKARPDPLAATRRVIVRAAAEIGRTMK
jgi:hypothetical protein